MTTAEFGLCPQYVPRCAYAKGLAENDRAESRKGSSYKGRATSSGSHPRTVPRSRRNPGSELEASLELADPVEEFTYEHGATVVEPEVPA